MLHYLENILGGHGIDLTTKDDYQRFRILQALQEAMIMSFQDLMGLTHEDIEDLTYHQLKRNAAGAIEETKKKLPIFQRRLLQAANAYWHAEQYKKLTADPTAMVDLPHQINYAEMMMFRVSKFSQGKIIQFVDYDRLRNHQLETFRKNTKPQIKDFPLFQDESTWPKLKEKFIVTLKACGLPHLIDEHYVPDNEELHEAESSWLYKVFQDRISNSIGKGIVAQHLEKMDCAAIWKDLCKRFDQSMSAEIRESNLATHITSFRLANGKWRGTRQAFITHFRETYRQLQDISERPFTDAQMVMFLNQAVQGVPGLENVLVTHKTARRAAGNNVPVTFEEYAQELISAAQVLDQSTKYKTNPRSQ